VKRGDTTIQTPQRQFVRLEQKQAVLRVCCDRMDVVREELGRQRELLEAYLRRRSGFATSLTPVDVEADAPELVRRMADAGRRAGVGPMAAVAGAIAQKVGEAAVAAGAREAIVENGGDVYIAALTAPLRMAIYAGAGGAVADRLAFLVPAEHAPLAVCSSSGVMGHSFSLGRCELAAVVARDAGLADAVATLAANLVGSAADLEPAMRRAMAVDGVDGVLIVHDGRIGLQGRLPELVRNLADTSRAFG
jgi:ApbE superfamily uncharacterized protein (UPF0280 family)